MASKAGQGVIKPTEPPVGSVVNVLVLYEDLGTALLAKRTLDRLSEQLHGESRISTWLWRLDLLAESLLAERAAIEAAAAEVIIVSLRGRAGLRAEVRTWLDRWRQHKRQRPYALAALLDPEPERPESENQCSRPSSRLPRRRALTCSAAPVRRRSWH
jgi:hypothetical protein